MKNIMTLAFIALVMLGCKKHNESEVHDFDTTEIEAKNNSEYLSKNSPFKITKVEFDRYLKSNDSYASSSSKDIDPSNYLLYFNSNGSLTIDRFENGTKKSTTNSTWKIDIDNKDLIKTDIYLSDVLTIPTSVYVDSSFPESKKEIELSIGNPTSNPSKFLLKTNFISKKEGTYVFRYNVRYYISK